MRPPCICTKCRPRTGALSDFAPRLARARDDLVEHLRVSRIAREEYGRELLHLEQLVAHRELQLARSYSTQSGRYIAARQRKLRESKGILARHVARGVVLKEAA